MVSGGSTAARNDLARVFKPLNMTLVQAGGAGAVDAKDADNKLIPGGGVSMQLVGGDGDISAVGTVTDVVGGR